MKNKKNWLGILVIVLVFGIMVIGCDNGTTSDDISGTWSNWCCADCGEKILIFNNGNYTLSNRNGPIERGTYRTNGGILTITVTEIHGGNHWLAEDFSWEIGVELVSRWYTRNELISLAGGNNWLIEEINNVFSSSCAVAFSRSGNTLVIGHSTWTRR